MPDLAALLAAHIRAAQAWRELMLLKVHDIESVERWQDAEAALARVLEAR